MIQSLADLYAAWHEAEPDAGLDPTSGTPVPKKGRRVAGQAACGREPTRGNPAGVATGIDAADAPLVNCT